MCPTLKMWLTDNMNTLAIRHTGVNMIKVKRKYYRRLEKAKGEHAKVVKVQKQYFQTMKEEYVLQYLRILLN